jgi:hypothetical protein
MHAAPEQPSRMPRPRLPTRTGDAWECGFLFDSARDVRGVSCRGGLVVAGGDELHVLRPGAQRMASRAPPLDIGPIRVTAAEPRAPWRYAVASDDLVALFYRTEAGDQILRLRCTPPTTGQPLGVPTPSATHLAWGRDGDASTLYIRWSDGGVVRVKQDMSGVDTTDLPPMNAIAADNAGVLAMISFAAPTPRAYVTQDGEHLDLRGLDDLAAPPGHVYLAIAGTAVAFAIGQGGAWLSRDTDAPFERIAALGTAGPLDFEGVASDSAVFGATHHAGIASILRVDAEGEALRIADFGGDAGVVPVLTGLGWDASRDMIWGASPEMGLVTCTAPSAKHGKKGLVS